MAVLEHLEPKTVFHIFEELCAIPHGSGNTKAIREWCMDFARQRGLPCRQDEAGNVVIWGAASPGYENAPAVILQGHVDMVCEKESGCEKDMASEGLDLAVDGDFVFAKGTTLGGDDGSAVAMALAVLDDPAIPHPPLEVALTVDEEIGMLGAAALDPTGIRGRQLINLDSEEEGGFIVSCAGGSQCICSLPVAREPFSGTDLRLELTGLTGGHSGTEIQRQLANAIVSLGRTLQEAADRTELRIVSLTGGGKSNAIPTLASALVRVSDESAFRRAAADMEQTLRREYRVSDPGLQAVVTAAEPSETPMDRLSTEKALCLLTCFPNGVQAMSADIPDLVETSLNLGILLTSPDAVEVEFCVRSSVASRKELLHRQLRCLAEQLGGSMRITGDYPAWEYRPDSALRERMTSVFREQYGREPVVAAIHAGLECGLLCGRLEGLDCVSAGADILDIHTPRERMSISSVQRVWAFLLEVLRRSR